MIGVQIGTYRVQRKLGEGGMGTIWLAQHVVLGKRVAIKVLHAEMSVRQELVARFFNEAKAATEISDPGIVQVFDFGKHTDGSAYIVMELLEGEALDRRLTRLGKLSIASTLRICRQVASTLGAAHARGIVHRDIKPENIFLVRDPEVAGGERTKVLDFGIAKMAIDTRIKTKTSALLGTPTFMSPEQCRGAGQVDQRSDVYSMGCVLFTLLTGRPVFEGEGAGDIISMHLREAPPVPSSLRPEIPSEVDALILRCLIKDRAQRFSSGKELATALEQLLASPALQPLVRAASTVEQELPPEDETTVPSPPLVVTAEPKEVRAVAPMVTAVPVAAAMPADPSSVPSVVLEGVVSGEISVRTPNAAITTLSTSARGGRALPRPLRLGILGTLAVTPVVLYLAVSAWRSAREGAPERQPAASASDDASTGVVSDLAPLPDADAGVSTEPAPPQLPIEEIERDMDRVLRAFEAWSAGKPQGGDCPSVEEVFDKALLPALASELRLVCTGLPAGHAAGVVWRGLDGAVATADDLSSWTIAADRVAPAKAVKVPPVAPPAKPNPGPAPGRKPLPPKAAPRAADPAAPRLVDTDNDGIPDLP